MNLCVAPPQLKRERRSLRTKFFEAYAQKSPQGFLNDNSGSA